MHRRRPASIQGSISDDGSSKTTAHHRGAQTYYIGAVYRSCRTWYRHRPSDGEREFDPRFLQSERLSRISQPAKQRATSAARAQSRRHFLGKQSDGIEHAVDRDLAAHVRFHDDASQAKLIAQLPQPREHHARCTVGHPILQQIVIGHLRQPCGAFRAVLGAGCASSADGARKILGETAIGANRAGFRLGTSPLGRFRNVDGNPECTSRSPV
jgi:hypothetical protein